MKKLFAPLLFSLAVFLLSGCTNNMSVITAGLQTDLVRLQRTANGEIQVTWRMLNPNVVGYVLTRNSLKISLDGVPVGTVAGQERIGIPPLNQAERTAVLTLAGPAAEQAVAQAIARGSASYTLDATIWLLIVDEDIEKFTLTAAGTLPASAE